MVLNMQAKSVETLLRNTCVHLYTVRQVFYILDQMDRQRGWYKILKKNKDPYKALMDCRNTEIQGRKSPAWMFQGRCLKTNLPATADRRPVKNNQHAKLQTQKMKNKELRFDKWLLSWDTTVSEATQATD